LCGDVEDRPFSHRDIVSKCTFYRNIPLHISCGERTYNETTSGHLRAHRASGRSYQQIAVCCGLEDATCVGGQEPRCPEGDGASCSCVCRKERQTSNGDCDLECCFCKVTSVPGYSNDIGTWGNTPNSEIAFWFSNSAVNTASRVLNYATQSWT
jgi:hypothetical protein